MAFDLRGYQSGLVDRGEAVMLNGGVPAIVAPTGAGKTVLLSEVARRAIERGEQVLAVCHRGEIIEQLARSLRKHLGSRTLIEVVRAGSKTPMRSQVIIGMVPTLSRRTHRLGHLRGCTLLQDECHHAGARSWEAVTEAVQPRHRMGFTATPIRPNGKGLGDEGGFTELVIGPQPGELMDMGALCRYRMIATEEQIDNSNLRKNSTGDYSVEDMEQQAKQINGNIVRDWRMFNPNGDRTIFVGVSVDHAHAVANMFNAQGIPAEAVDGKTPKALRTAIFARFRAGQIRVLCACAVVDEGLDVPEATVLQMTRSTTSIRLYRQLCGRVLRPAPGKTIATIIDHTTNWKDLDPPDAAIKWDLFQEKAEVEEPKTAKRDPDTGEVILAPLVVVPGDGDILENGAQMRDVTDQMLLKSRPNMARKILNERVMEAIREELLWTPNVPGLPPKQHPRLRQFLSMTAILDDDTIHALGNACGMQHGWAQGQIMLNMVQSPKQRDTATARCQEDWQRIGRGVG
jgi:superfamily II DNA or RNA helicase